MRSTWRITFKRSGSSVLYVADTHGVLSRGAAIIVARARIRLRHPDAVLRVVEARQLNRKRGV